MGETLNRGAPVLRSEGQRGAEPQPAHLQADRRAVPGPGPSSGETQLQDGEEDHAQSSGCLGVPHPQPCPRGSAWSHRLNCWA